MEFALDAEELPMKLETGRNIPTKKRKKFSKKYVTVPM
jgi:hypothetical protein